MIEDKKYTRIDVNGVKSEEVCSIGGISKCKECQVPGCPLRVGDVPILAK